MLLSESILPSVMKRMGLKITLQLRLQGFFYILLILLVFNTDNMYNYANVMLTPPLPSSIVCPWWLLCFPLVCTCCSGHVCRGFSISVFHHFEFWFVKQYWKRSSRAIIPRWESPMTQWHHRVFAAVLKIWFCIAPMAISIEIIPTEDSEVFCQNNFLRIVVDDA